MLGELLKILLITQTAVGLKLNNQSVAPEDGSLRFKNSWPGQEDVELYLLIRILDLVLKKWYISDVQLRL